NINATFRPTAHAVGYFLAPLRGFRSPGALSKRLWGKPYPYSSSMRQNRALRSNRIQKLQRVATSAAPAKRG
ncbi:MAG: hypothetical protein ABSF46_21935, partial [Terriglobia bacterium]